MEKALRDRADLRALRSLVAAARLRAETADRESLPDLSVTATVGVRGLAGSRRDPDDRPCNDPAANCAEEFFEGGLGQSFANAPRFPLFGVTARLDIPVPNTTASREAEATALDARARAAELERGEWTVRNQVRQAVFALLQAQDRLRTSGEALRLAEESLAGERRKFEAGVSTIFEVSSMQEALAAAQNARFGALARYQVAKATLGHRRGTLLSDLGVRQTGR
jgi:outer membrane protein TolC